MEIGQDASEALKPAAHGYFVVALTAKCVDAGNAVMDMRRDCFHRLIPAMVVDVVEGLSDLLLHDVTVWQLISPAGAIARQHRVGRTSVYKYLDGTGLAAEQPAV